ncbi:methionine--tRNA ligase [candidate division WWE3 bacterium CG10_big_fil_rev_8_21_14_0_10_32_10]|uniref:Methionine--tRNA ligase n=1 Tax=candidate division WWE3 bacterium CG10_big_fil_rev_8_21_14_0_10_32_10 TaxID=1975090 RepID=A0A2H0RBB8_UNCKA|nr:MAG: methionine--tRNA ligase [candidate division WWE3 bacterium CG10_big_fil_rev_8_21_14_0_10_32_10]
MKKFYITTTLPYVNADPHIGFALEIIQADAIARYYRQKGYEVFFNTGTDEHGQKIYNKAQEQNKNTQDYVDYYARQFDSLKKALNLSYNSFIRTTEPIHKKAAQEFWNLCLKNGDIYKDLYKIKYCVGCELEKTDSELVDGRCPLHPNLEIQEIEEENYYFKFSKYQKPLLDFYEKNSNFVLPEFRFTEIKNFVQNGLKDFSISRLKSKMPWGIPVPGDNDHVMYVWFDALINYVSCLGWPSNTNTRFAEFWPGIQIAGKDNLRQQSAMWQAMLMSAGLPNSKQILIHGFMTSNGQKMSKSLGNVVNPLEVAKKYGSDALRYYLLKEVPTFEDGDYSEKSLVGLYNADLANGIGNLVSRITKLCENSQKEYTLDFTSTKLNKELEDLMSNYSLNAVCKLFEDSIADLNKSLHEKKPWENLEDSFELLQSILNESLYLVKTFSFILPDLQSKVLSLVEENKTSKIKHISGLYPRILV